MKKTESFDIAPHNTVPVDEIDMDYLLATGYVRNVSEQPEPEPRIATVTPVMLGMDEIDFGKTLRSGQVTPKDPS